MKILRAIFIAMIFNLGSHAQSEIHSYSTTFEIKHSDFFSYMSSEPIYKNWNFQLKIIEVGTGSFRACYSKELADCLLGLHDLRKENIRLQEVGSCFQYVLVEDNDVIVTDDSDVMEYLRRLAKYKSKNMPRKDRKEILQSVKFFLKNRDELEKEITRELSLIHEYENSDIPIGISDILVDTDEQLDLSELEEDEIDFLERIDWETIGHLEVYNTKEINESEFVLDYLFGIDVIGSGERADFDAIAHAFFDGTLNLDQNDNVTLHRDQRLLNKTSKELSYLLKQRRTVSSTMKKITTLEIRKLRNGG